jgi:hypothetical protein
MRSRFFRTPAELPFELLDECLPGRDAVETVIIRDGNRHVLRAFDKPLPEDWYLTAVRAHIYSIKTGTLREPESPGRDFRDALIKSNVGVI